MKREGVLMVKNRTLRVAELFLVVAFFVLAAGVLQGFATSPLVDFGGAQAGVVKSADLTEVENRLDRIEQKLQVVEKRLGKLEKGY